MSRPLESWLQWVVVTSLNGFVAVFIAYASAEGLPPIGPEGIRLFIGSIMGGILLGMAQWFFAS